MAKVVKIPSFNNPFVLTINGCRYSYEAGKTVEVPDEVAEAIENVLANMPTSFYNKDKETLATKEYVKKTVTSAIGETIGDINTILATLVTLGG